MAQTGSPKLDVGDRFPTMTISLLNGDSVTLPDKLDAEFTVFLGYRGKW